VKCFQSVFNSRSLVQGATIECSSAAEKLTPSAHLIVELLVQSASEDYLESKGGRAPKKTGVITPI
jgi:hypothetical protein